MMKKILFLVVLVLVGGSLYAGAPDNNSGVVGTAVTTATEVDSVIGGTWQVLESGVVALTDSCYVYYNCHGLARIWPGTHLYISVYEGATVTSAVDTLHFYNDVNPRDEKVDTINFGCMFFDSLWSATDREDSCYIAASVGHKTQKAIIDSMSVEVAVEAKNVTE